MKAPITIAAIFTLCLPLMTSSPALGQVRQIELYVLGPSPQPELAPLSDLDVWLVPNAGSLVQHQKTDSQGRVQFVFPETDYVSVTVVRSGMYEELPRMSGRLDQRTSVYFGGFYAVRSAPLEPIEQLLLDIRQNLAGRPAPPHIRQALGSIRNQLLESEMPFPEDRGRRRRSEGVEETEDAESLEASEYEERRRALLAEIEELGAVDPPARQWYLGINPEYTRRGIFIRGVFPNTAAAEAELRAGDWILSVDGQPVASSADLQAAFGRSASGHVRLEIARRGGTREIHVQLRPQGN